MTEGGFENDNIVAAQEPFGPLQGPLLVPVPIGDLDAKELREDKNLRKEAAEKATQTVDKIKRQRKTGGTSGTGLAVLTPRWRNRTPASARSGTIPSVWPGTSVILAAVVVRRPKRVSSSCA